MSQAKPRAIVASFLLFASAASAQQPPIVPPDPAAVIEKQRKDSTVLAAEWIHSSDARTRAWGAYIVLRDRLTDRLPDLLSLTESYDVTGGAASLAEGDDHATMLAILDALIQMRAEVPPDTTAKLYLEFPAQSMILMVNSAADSTSPLLHIFQTENSRNGAWLAAGNLLVDRRSPAFAATVLSGLVVHLQVLVISGGGGFGGGCYDCGGFGGSTFSLPRTGWPEIGNYSLSACAATQNVTLVNGVHPAYYRRTVGNSYRSGSDSPCPGADRDEIRADYLATLLSPERDHLPIPSRVKHSIIWTDSATYLSKVGQFIADQQDLFAETGNRLRSAGWMTEPEVTSSRPTLEITITDTRESPTTPLPNPPAAGGVIFQ